MKVESDDEMERLSNEIDKVIVFKVKRIKSEKNLNMHNTTIFSNYSRLVRNERICGLFWLGNISKKILDLGKMRSIKG